MATEQGKRMTFVAPYGEADIPPARDEQFDHAPYAPTDLLPPVAQTMVEVRGTFTDRAKGFQIASVPLAAGVGLGSLIVGIVGWGVPFFSVAALAWLWTGFLVTWFSAWVIHNLVSPDGIALVHTLLGWQYLHAARKEREKRYGGRR